MNYGPQGLSNMIDSKVPILRPGEFGKKYVDDVMPSLPKDMMKPLPPEEKDRKNPFVYDDYYDPMSGGTYSDNSNSLTSSMDILSSGSAFNDKIETDTTPIETPADVTGTKDLKELPIVTDLTGFLDQKKGSHLAI